MIGNDVYLLTVSLDTPPPLFLLEKNKKKGKGDKNRYFVYIFVVGDRVATN